MRKKYVVITTILILIAAGWGFFLYKYLELKNQDNYYGTYQDKEAPDFTLTSHSGTEVSLSEFRGKVVPVFFGYTSCPDICPVTLSAMKEVIGELGELDDKVQVLFITVDPERDTVEKLRGYIPYFDESFIGLTGTPAEIDRVAKSFNISFFKEDTDSEAGYLITHASSVYLIDPEGKLLLKYPHNKLDPKLIAEDIRKILG